MLLTVILLLALAAISLAAVCRATLRQSTDADTAAAELQRRWGMLSARTTLLPAADGLLDRFAPPGVPRLHASFDLTGTHFDIEMCDEEAKPNVNEMIELAEDPTAVARVISAWVKPQAVRIRPAVGRSQNLSLPTDVRFNTLIGSYSELFPGLGWPAADDPRSPVNAVTCWGTGRLNVTRAGRAAVAEICGKRLSPSEIDQLISLARTIGNRQGPLDLLNAVHPNDATMYTLADRMTNVSNTYSAWIVATDKTGTDREMSVMQIVPDPDNATGDDLTRWFLYRW